MAKLDYEKMNRLRRPRLTDEQREQKIIDKKLAKKMRKLGTKPYQPTGLENPMAFKSRKKKHRRLTDYIFKQ